MNFLKRNSHVLLIALCELVIGILLLIRPVEFTRGIIIACGVVMLAFGIVSLINYFRTNAATASVGQLLFRGLILLSVGAFCTFESQWFINTLPLLTVVYGIFLLIAGLGKIQNSVDRIRMKRRGWLPEVIGAVIAIACAVVIFANPFDSTRAIWMFIGIILIVGAVYDIVMLIAFRKAWKSDGDQTKNNVIDV